MGYLDHVMIEQQINNNIQMKVLSHVIQTFYICENKLSSDDIFFLSPKSRFSSSDSKYNEMITRCKERVGHLNNRVAYKRLSILVCTEIIPLDWREFLENNEKKDDLADCFLQFYSWYVDKKDYPDIVIR